MPSEQEKQSDIISWLTDPKTHGCVGDVQRIDTHAAIVFLAGDFAFKMKRAVKFAYLDFSTTALRHHYLLRELQLNRRLAPQIYKRVKPIYRRNDGTFSFEAGEGTEAVEWVLEMSRFDPAAVLDRVAERGELSASTIDKLATLVSTFHASAPPHKFRHAAERFAKILLSNDAELHACGAFGPERVAALQRASIVALDECRALLDERGASGFVRQCHGDLHLGNIVSIEGALTLFDCLEFSDEMAQIDVLYDLAFLLMDLIQHRIPALANRLLNGYVAEMPFGDLRQQLQGLRLLSLFISCRAAIRAHVAARSQSTKSRNAGRSTLGLSYLELAEKALTPTQPQLIAVGGLSGSGKSTLARNLAPLRGPIYGALVLRTDVLRKRKMGLTPTERLAPSAYSQSAATLVYEDMMKLAGEALASGQTVILDAVFALEKERDAAQALATKFGAPFRGIWLETSSETMAARLDARKDDASDATRGILSRQLTYDLGNVTWLRIDSSGESDQVLGHVLAACGSRNA